MTFDHFDLQVVADGRHSVPTQIRIDAGDDSRIIDLPAIADGTAENATVAVPVPFAPMTGSDARITVTEVRTTFTEDYYCDCPHVDAGRQSPSSASPACSARRFRAQLPTTCRTDADAIDDQPVGVRMLGSDRRRGGRQAWTCSSAIRFDPTAPPTVALARAITSCASQSGKRHGHRLRPLVLGSDSARRRDGARRPRVAHRCRCRGRVRSRCAARRR